MSLYDITHVNESATIAVCGTSFAARDSITVALGIAQGISYAKGT